MQQRERTLKRLKLNLAKCKDKLEGVTDEYMRRLILDEMRDIRNARAKLYRNK